MKKCLSFFLLVVLLLSLVLTGAFSLPANAAATASGTCGDNLTWALDGSGTLTISGSGPMYNMVSEHGERVSPWSDFANQILRLVVEEGVTDIGQYAFVNFTGMTEVSLPETVTAIGAGAFLYCSSLQTVDIPQGVTRIEQDLFGNCSALTSAILPAGVTYIGYNAFGNCVSLAETNIPSGVQEISTGAYLGCETLRAVHIPQATTSIGEYAFAGCTNLERITVDANNKYYYSDNYGALYNKNKTTLYQVPGGYTGVFTPLSTITYVGRNSFRGCRSVTSVTIPYGVTSIGDNAFYECNALQTVAIPATVTSIGSYAFYNCASLRSVAIPSGVKSILYSTFYGCTALTSVSIPGTVTSIGGNAFYNCSSLESVNIPSSVTEIGNSAFYQAGISTLSLSSGLTSIGEYAFYKCRNLTTVTIPASLTEIKIMAFSGCGLTSIKVASGSTAFTTDSYGVLMSKDKTIIYQAPVSLSGSYTIPSTVTTIKYSAFRDCTRLTKVTIPQSVTAINGLSMASVSSGNPEPSIDHHNESSAFYNCTALTGFSVASDNANYSSDSYGALYDKDKTYLYQVPSTFSGIYTVADTVKRTVMFSFFNCTNLTGVIMPSSLENLSAYTFYNCPKLTRIDISGKITSLSSHSICYCENLTTVTIPETVTSILSYVVVGCDKIEWNIYGNLCYIGTLNNPYHGVVQLVNDEVTKVTYHKDMKAPPSRITTQWQNVRSVTFEEGITQIKRSAFANTASLEEIYIPASIVKIDQSAFASCQKLEHIYYSGTLEQWGQIEIAAYNEPLQKAKLHVGRTGNSCGDNLRWALQDGVLVISGTGAMDDYAPGRAPWFDQSGQISCVVVQNGVTALGENAFGGCANLVSAVIPKSLQTIGKDAFAGVDAHVTVFYSGSNDQKNTIAGSSALDDATWHYESYEMMLEGKTVYMCDDCGLLYNRDGSRISLKELQITKLPEKRIYTLDEEIDGYGIELRGCYGDDLWIELRFENLEFNLADASKPGKAMVTVSALNATAQYEIYLHETVRMTPDPSTYPESAHNYAGNTNETKTFTYPGAKYLILTFSSKTSTEKGYDYLYLYNGNGEEVATFTGTEAAGQTVKIHGDTFQIKLTSDPSQNKYGYAFSSIVADTGELVHPEVIDEATVTCTQAGLTHGSHCEICGQVLVTQEQRPALGHSYKASFTWSEDHKSCQAHLTCARNCGWEDHRSCTVTEEKTENQTVHKACIEEFCDELTCDNYRIVFYDRTGKEIKSDYYHYGDAVTAPSVKTSDADEAYTYTFTGWDKEVVPCTGNATYTATYMAKAKEPIRPDAIEGEYAEEINLWLKVFVPENFKGDEDAYLVMTKQGGYGVETVTIKGSELGNADAKGRYLLKMGIASGEMTSAVTYEFYDADGYKMSIVTSSGNNMGNTATFSLLNYARSMLRTGTDAQKKMVAAMLTYGGYAQKYFGVDAQNPAYNLLTELGMAVPSLDGVTADRITDSTVVVDGQNGIKATGMQAFLDSAIYLRVYFNLAEGADIDDYKFVLTYADPEGNTHTKEVEAGYEAGRNRYYVDIEDIPAAYLDYMYNITVTNTKTNATYSVTTSVIVWVKNSLNSSYNEDQKNLLKAIYLYNQAANELFGK